MNFLNISSLHSTASDFWDSDVLSPTVKFTDTSISLWWSTAVGWKWRKNYGVFCSNWKRYPSVTCSDPQSYGKDMLGMDLSTPDYQTDVPLRTFGRVHAHKALWNSLLQYPLLNFPPRQSWGHFFCRQGNPITQKQDFPYQCGLALRCLCLKFIAQTRAIYPLSCISLFCDCLSYSKATPVQLAWRRSLFSTCSEYSEYALYMELFTDSKYTWHPIHLNATSQVNTAT